MGSSFVFQRAASRPASIPYRSKAALANAMPIEPKADVNLSVRM
jgi:hypothetical protein|eukprot:COSAG06_NODE_5352_length_3531_cov_95.618007_5_plen_44_part_00